MEELITLEPSMLFISEEDWQVEERRDTFLNNLLQALSEIDSFKTHKITWTMRLEEILWSSPQYNPWLNMYDYKNSIITILYKYLNSNTIFVDSIKDKCTSEPCISLKIDNQEIIDEYYAMFNTNINENLDFCLYSNCIHQSLTNIKFVSSIGIIYCPKILNNILDYFKHLPIEEILWPISHDDKEVCKLNKALDIFRQTYFNNLSFNYNYSFSNQFIKNLLSSSPLQRKNILTKITKRLCCSTKEAGLDSQLQDEIIIRSKERRFRVTPRPSSTRIHYQISNSNTLVFLNYYNIGEHDDAL